VTPKVVQPYVLATEGITSFLTCITSSYRLLTFCMLHTKACYGYHWVYR